MRRIRSFYSLPLATKEVLMQTPLAVDSNGTEVIWYDIAPTQINNQTSDRDRDTIDSCMPQKPGFRVSYRCARDVLRHIQLNGSNELVFPCSARGDLYDDVSVLVWRY